MKLLIKNMVSLRCKMVVRDELKKVGLRPIVVELGEVQVQGNVSAKQHDALKIALPKSGFELIEDRKAVLIEKVKNVIIEMIHYMDELPDTKFSDYLAEKLNYDYRYLSLFFMEVKGITIEQFFIKHKIERVKELLLYEELTLTEIADKLKYSSVAHLSNQFKKVTGLTPTFFKNLKNERRKVSGKK
jgi:AraC-like DNA-binding protein